MRNWNIIGRKKIYLTISALLILSAVAAIVFFGFKEGIDFKGGTLWQVKISGADIPAIEQIIQQNFSLRDSRISKGSEADLFLIRLPEINEKTHQDITAALKTKFSNFEEVSYDSIGPSVGSELRRKSIIGVILVLVGISLYIAFAFRKVYRPVSSWKYGWITLVTLLHDVLIPAGLLAVLGKYKGIEIDSNFVVALLVVMGFSVHDTIVVFDRIRENLLADRGKTEFGEVVNASVNQTFARSVNTSLTLILVLLALYFVGPVNLKYFILTLLVGVTIGIYSSIFVASPLLHVWQGFSKRKTK